MRSKLMTGAMSEGPTTMAPRWPGTDIPAGQPLPPGATVDTVIETTNRWTPDGALQTIGTISAAEQFLAAENIIKPTGINFGELAQNVARFAGIGTFFGPGLGTIIGAAAGLLVSVAGWIFGRNDQPAPPILAELANSPDPVQQWAVSYAQIDFINWCVENGFTNVPTVADLAKLQLTYWLDRYGYVICWSNARFYSGIRDAVYIDSVGGEDAAASLYRQMMADYWATKNARDAAGVLNTNDGYTINAVYKARVNIPGQQQAEDAGGSSAVALAAVAAVGVLIMANNNE